MNGTKYLYESLPRLLTIWMECATSIQKNASSVTDENNERIAKFGQINRFVRKLQERLPSYQFLTAIPQLISRISHKHPAVKQLIDSIIISVLCIYPQQTLWHLMAVAKSTITSRSARVLSILSKVKVL